MEAIIFDDQDTKKIKEFQINLNSKRFFSHGSLSSDNDHGFLTESENTQIIDFDVKMVNIQYFTHNYKGDGKIYAHYTTLPKDEFMKTILAKVPIELQPPKKQVPKPEQVKDLKESFDKFCDTIHKAYKKVNPADYFFS